MLHCLTRTTAYRQSFRINLGHKPSSPCPRTGPGRNPDRVFITGISLGETPILNPCRDCPAAHPRFWGCPAKATANSVVFCEPNGRPTRGVRPTDDGGGERDRTDDLMLAKHALSRLSYAPGCWWAREDLNLRPHAYQARALTKLSY